MTLNFSGVLQKHLMNLVWKMEREEEEPERCADEELGKSVLKCRWSTVSLAGGLRLCPQGLAFDPLKVFGIIINCPYPKLGGVVVKENGKDRI